MLEFSIQVTLAWSNHHCQHTPGLIIGLALAEEQNCEGESSAGSVLSKQSVLTGVPRQRPNAVGSCAMFGEPTQAPVGSRGGQITDDLQKQRKDRKCTDRQVTNRRTDVWTCDAQTDDSLKTTQTFLPPWSVSPALSCF
ncbi:hypothetical protein Bbelb_183500 [Branchiostoma belcheri]|nr:hypothetical protein Bbelb_183500 [Branchiostoma belcheri]